jgi:hypothetical protein
MANLPAAGSVSLGIIQSGNRQAVDQTAMTTLHSPANAFPILAREFPNSEGFGLSQQYD